MLFWITLLACKGTSESPTPIEGGGVGSDEADADTDADADADADTDTDTDRDERCVTAQAVVDGACLGCHDQQALGGLDLRDLAAVVDRPASGSALDTIEPGQRTSSYLYLKITDAHLAAGGAGDRMPPPPAAALAAADVETIGVWIDNGAVCDAVVDTDTDPGVLPGDEVGASPRFARLTHVQWENTVQDLFGLGPTGVSETFIGDVLSAGGFDNDGVRLQVGSELWSDYQRAAEEVSRAVVNDTTLYPAVVPEDPTGNVVLGPPIRHEAEDIEHTVGGPAGPAWMVWANGEAWVDQVLDPGAWTMVVRAYGTQAGTEPVRMELRVDDVALDTVDVTSTDLQSAQEFEVDFTATGTHRIAAAFINDFVDPNTGDDRNLVVDWIELRPLTSTAYDPLTDRPLARAFIERFGPKVYRRPLTTAEVDRYLLVFDAGVDLPYTQIPFRDGIYTVLVTMLQSPHFLYRVEAETTPDATGDIPLGNYTIASKLSYGLWNTMPDDLLFQAAADGRLVDPVQLRLEAERMLGHPKATGAVDRFHHQLLNLDSYGNIYKDPAVFPGWSQDLNVAMAEEARAYTRDAVFSGASIFELYTAPHTFVGPELAPLYGETVAGPDPVRVDLDPTQRAGLLTQVGFLAANAHAIEIDSIHRGVFVNLKLLCSDLPPPPNMVAPLPPPQPGLTNRQRVDQHTGVGTCGQGCHSTLINPIGFAFESYDALGQWRQTDAGQPVDSSGAFLFETSYQSWDDTVGFAAELGSSPDAHRCLIGNWLRYTHGRDLTPEDENLVDRLTTESLATDLPIRDVMLELVTADSFRYRSPEVTP